MSEIRSFRVKRFKRLEDFELILDNTTVLIGANNAGKSSALQALHFAVAIAQTARLVGQGVQWGADKFALSFNPTQSLYSPVADVLSLAYGGSLAESSSQQIEIEIVLNDDSKCLLTVKRGRNRNIQVSLTGRQVGERLMDLNRPFTVYAPGLAGIAKDERYMSPGVVRRVVARGDANLVLRNVLLMMRDEENWELEIGLDRGPDGPWTNFQRDMETLFPGLSIDIQFDHHQDETINVYFTQNQGPKLPIDAAGTSILQASQILAYISLFRPQVLILDEPDSHLHPNNQRALCDLVTQLAETRGFRALLSTHSRHVLDSLKNRAKIVWVNQGKKIDYDVISTPGMLMELGALDSVDYFVNGRLTCLFATEDSARESIHALNSLLEANGFRMPEVDIRAYSGCSKIDSARVLRRFLCDKAPNVRFVIHRDRDYMGDEDAIEIENSLKGIDTHAFITDHSDLEGYFLNARHIAELNPEITVEHAQALIDNATKATREKSIAKLINLRTEAALRLRRNGSTHNPGKLAIEASSDYDTDPERWRRGKIVLNELRSSLHKELGRQAVILKASEHLKVNALEAIRDVIWSFATSKT
jgi:hypothetical protein